MSSPWDQAQQACADGNLELLKSLLAGASVIGDGAALVEEITSGRLASADEPSSDDSKRLYIMMEIATKSAHLDTVRFLFGKYPATRFGSKKSPVYYAFRSIPGAADLVRFWLERDPGAVNIKACEGSCLHCALLFVKERESCLEIVKVLLEYGADVNEYADDNYDCWNYQTPLKIAVRFSFPEVVELLKEHGARDGGLRPLLSAVEASHVPMIQYLLDHGADPNELKDKDSTGTPLHAAAVIGDVEVVDILLKHGADTSVCSAMFGDKDMISRLIYDYPNLKDQGFRDIGFDKASGTPLHAAAMMGRVDVVGLLLKHGADVGIENNEGMVALEVAKKYGREGVVEILKGKDD